MCCAKTKNVLLQFMKLGNAKLEGKKYFILNFPLLSLSTVQD